MLELKKIEYQPATSEKPLLKQVSMVGNVGRPVIINGVSGAGKTSLVEIIGGLARPNRGKISWQGENLKERQRSWLCGVVFQFPERYFLGLTIYQELRLGHKRLENEPLMRVLKEVGLDKIDLKKPPELLSGGQQRRLAIAVQLLRKPSIFLLDEPTAGLDWSSKDEIIDLLKEISKNKLLIIATHEPELFKDWSIDNYELDKGKLKKINSSPGNQS